MLPSRNFFFCLQVLFLLSFQAVARKWRDTGGGIIMEEAWTIPELLFQIRFTSTRLRCNFCFANVLRDSNTTIAIGTNINIALFISYLTTQNPVGGTVDGLKANLLDIHNQRLGFMNANDIDFVSSITLVLTLPPS